MWIGLIWPTTESSGRILANTLMNLQVICWPDEWMLASSNRPYFMALCGWLVLCGSPVSLDAVLTAASYNHNFPSAQLNGHGRKAEMYFDTVTQLSSAFCRASQNFFRRSTFWFICCNDSDVAVQLTAMYSYVLYSMFVSPDAFAELCLVTLTFGYNINQYHNGRNGKCKILLCSCFSHF